MRPKIKYSIEFYYATEPEQTIVSEVKAYSIKQARFVFAYKHKSKNYRIMSIEPVREVLK